MAVPTSLTGFKTQNPSDDIAELVVNDASMEDYVPKVRPKTVKNMPSDCAVFDLLSKHQCFVTNPNSKEKKPYDTCSHGLMHGEHGGGFVLPNLPDIEKRFLACYATDITNGITHYIIERRTPFFKFHADLDIKRKEPMDEENMIMLMNDFLHSVQKFYPSTTAISRFDMMVCTSIGNGKTGIHVIFPNLIVNQNQAIDIRNYYVSYLISKYGDMVGIQNSWEDIVDMSVYEANGLRMVGSNKTEDCKECGGKKKSKKDTPRRDICDVCRGRGKIDTGKVYMPKFYLRNGEIQTIVTNSIAKGLLTQISQNGSPRSIIELCSIRCPNVNESSSDFAISDEDMMKMTTTRTPKRPGSPRERIYKPVNTDLGTFRMTEEDVKGMNKWRSKQFIPVRSEQYQLLQEYIQSKNFPSYWRKLSIHNMFTNPKKTFYVVNVRGEGQRYCLNNRKGNHKSNNIYFYVERNHITQRCFCSCQTTENRKNGKCEDFVSETIPLTTKLEKVLFPAVDSKIGHLHSDRAISATQDLDEYTFRIASWIAKADEERNEYLEERQQRLNHNKVEKDKPPTDEIDIQKRKRRKAVPKQH
jgi:hypothetical protein